MTPAEKRIVAARLTLEAHQSEHVNLDRFRRERGRDPSTDEVALIALLTLCDECDRLKLALLDEQAKAVASRGGGRKVPDE